MPNTIREPRDSDFFPWLSLYEGYAAARGTELTEEKALLLWTWVTDPAKPETALVALNDAGDVVGFTHFHVFPRPLLGDLGVFLDALYAPSDASDHQAVESELLDAVRGAAAAHGASVIRWTQAEGERLPAVLASSASEPVTMPPVFELQTVPQPA